MTEKMKIIKVGNRFHEIGPPDAFTLHAFDPGHRGMFAMRERRRKAPLTPPMQELLNSVRSFYALNGRPERVFGNRQRSARALRGRGLVEISAEPSAKKGAIVLFVTPVIHEGKSR